MKRFIEGADRSQVTLLPECLDDYIAEDNPVRVVDAFVDELDLRELGFESAEPAATGGVVGRGPGAGLPRSPTAASSLKQPVEQLARNRVRVISHLHTVQKVEG
jgi:hypothetical protein